ncbi:hypothetical protein [Veronia pacifica]|uniref:hypothetical protein n=1 Tax=Veronia pacifica TaxID=1080227 RepID=UPI0026C3511E
MLKEGEKIPGFEDWVAYFTPGHTDRDLSLLHEPTRTVYVADLIVKIRDKYVPPVPISYPNRYKRSLEKIRNLEKDYFILAHGGENRAEEVDLDLLIQRSPDEPLTQWKVIWKNIHQRLLFNMFKQKNRR